jgi:hypothetical protein
MTTTAPVRRPDPGSRQRWGLPPWEVVMLAVAVVVALVGGGLTLWRIGPDGSTPTPSGGLPVTTAPAAPSPAPTAPAASSTPSTSPTAPASVPSSPSGTGTTPSTAFRFTPLWPFGSVADAVAWQRDAGAGGHQPWRMQAGVTAVAFAHDYLGYTEIDRVTSTQVVGDQAWVGVGFTPPSGAEGAQSTVAVLHLARIGGGALATRPWEVVGTRDTALTLTTPRYGATVGSTFTVGGRVTGVDESLVVQVTSLRGAQYTASEGLPAGGERTPWSATVVLDHPRDGIATVAVATGGHLMGVERFAVTAVTVRVP